MSEVNDSNVKLNVYFDGACHLCSREIDHYRRQNKNGALRFVNIADPNFDQSREGFQPFDDLQKVMHVKSSDGQIFTRIDAFTAIWSVLPGSGYKILSSVVNHRFLRPFADSGYEIFAKVRPYLPKKKFSPTEDSESFSGTCPR